jgi:hypothetical protein
VLDCPAEHETVLQRFHSSIRSAAEERRIAQNGLQRKMIAELAIKFANSSGNRHRHREPTLNALFLSYFSLSPVLASTAVRKEPSTIANRAF